MDASNEIVSVTASVVPKTLPMKYKAMLFANMSFINTHVADEAMKELLFSKLPIFKTVGEQIAYFDKEADMKTVEQTIFKPMLKDQKQKEKIAMKPAPKKKQKKAAADTEKKVAEVSVAVAVAAEPTAAEKELEFETEYPDAKPADVVQDKPVPTKKKTAPRKKKEEVVVAATPAAADAPAAAPAAALAPAKTVKPKAPRKEKRKAEEIVVAPPDTEDYYMIPFFIIPEGKYWTKDENFRNGPIYANGKDKDGDSAPGIVVGRLEDGIAIFEIV